MCFFGKSERTEANMQQNRRGLLFLKMRYEGHSFDTVCIEVEELNQQNQHSHIKVRSVTGIFDEYKDKVVQITPKWMDTKQITWL